MRMSSKLGKIPPYLFVEINRRIADKRAKGEDVISFAIGDPDLPTPAHIIKRLNEAALDPTNHRYPETDGLPVLRQAIAGWYEKRFGVKLDANTEVLPLIGSKEGIGHMAVCFVDPGDVILVPDPGYPVYSMGTILTGGEPYYLPLTEEAGFMPDLGSIPAEILRKAKVLWINYPNNPTGAVAAPGFFEQVVAFAARNGIAVCHDAPYTEVAFDGYRPPSFLETPGAREVGVEFHSLSKTYNMTGWRIGMAVGNRQMVNALFRVKSNLDSGIPQAIQLAAIAALTGPQESIAEHNRIIQARRDRLIPALRGVGLKLNPPKASFYIWARIPKGFTSAEFVLKLLDETAIAVTPGPGYGKTGEGYIRLSLTLPDAQLDEAIKRLAAWKPSAK